MEEMKEESEMEHVKLDVDGSRMEYKYNQHRNPKVDEMMASPHPDVPDTGVKESPEKPRNNDHEQDGA